MTDLQSRSRPTRRCPRGRSLGRSSRPAAAASAAKLDPLRRRRRSARDPRSRCRTGCGPADRDGRRGAEPPRGDVVVGGHQPDLHRGRAGRRVPLRPRARARTRGVRLEWHRRADRRRDEARERRLSLAHVGRPPVALLHRPGRSRPADHRAGLPRRVRTVARRRMACLRSGSIPMSTRCFAIRRLIEAASEGGAMRFLFLIHGDAEAEAAMTSDERRAIVEEHMAYSAMLRERGVVRPRRGARRSVDVGRRQSGRAAVRHRRPLRRDEGGRRRVLRRRLREPRRGARARRPRAAEPGVAVEVSRSSSSEPRVTVSTAAGGTRAASSCSRQVANVDVPPCVRVGPVPPTIGNVSFDGPSGLTWPYPSTSMVPPGRYACATNSTVALWVKLGPNPVTKVCRTPDVTDPRPVLVERVLHDELVATGGGRSNVKSPSGRSFFGTSDLDQS